MLLASDQLRVVPVTIHVPLAEVPHRLSTAGIIEAGRITAAALQRDFGIVRSEEHTSELQSLMRISYAVFCLKKKKNTPSLQKHIHMTHLHNKQDLTQESMTRQTTIHIATNE